MCLYIRKIYGLRGQNLRFKTPYRCEIANEHRIVRYYFLFRFQENWIKSKKQADDILADDNFPQNARDKIHAHKRLTY
jgi:signal peptidase I